MSGDFSEPPRLFDPFAATPPTGSVLPAPEDLTPQIGESAQGLAKLAEESAEPLAGQPPAPAAVEDRGFTARCSQIMTTTFDNVLQDYRDYYTCETLVEFVAVLAPAAVFANTDLDANVGNWYQDHIRSRATNHAADFFRPLGNGFDTIPIYVSAKLLGEYFDDVPGMGLLGEFGDRTCRALLVGLRPC